MGTRTHLQKNPPTIASATIPSRFGNAVRIFRTPNNYKKLINILIVFYLLFGSPTPVHAEHIEYSTTTAPIIIEAYAAHYGIPAEPLIATLKCESRFDATVVGDHGTSYGISQIHLPAHPDISKAQALDPLWAIDWAAHEFSLGHQSMWSCYKLLYGSEGS